MTHYETLGVEKNATDKEIKKAYQKLAQKHHPDKGGDENKFKEIKAAFEAIETAEKRAEYENPRQHMNFGDGRHPSSLDEILAMMRAQARAQMPAEFVANVPIAEAFKGFTMGLNLNGKKDAVKIPAGVPNLARGQYATEGGTKVIVTVRFIETQFKTKTINEARQIIAADGQSFTGSIDTGDAEISLDVDALDLMLGAWIQVHDLLGEKYDVRVPAGFSLSQRLKVKGKGYLNWSLKLDKADPVRADLYIRVHPVFKPVKDLDHTKIAALYELTRPKVTEEPT